MEPTRQDLSGLLAEFARERAQLLPALQRVQAELGSLPLWAIETVAEHLRVPRSEAYGVVEHYPELRQAPHGRYLVRICTGLSCAVRGGWEILSAVQAALDLEPGQTAPDGSLTLEVVPCAFLCSVAPIVEIGPAAHGGLSSDDALALVRSLSDGGPA